MSNHTPGPWMVTKHGTPDYAPQYGIYSIAATSDFVIVKSGEDDARLIAAAPDLLKALEDLVDTVEQDQAAMQDHMLDCTNPEACSLCMARAAIKQAKGEQ